MHRRHIEHICVVNLNIPDNSIVFHFLIRIRPNLWACAIGLSPASVSSPRHPYHAEHLKHETVTTVIAIPVLASSRIQIHQNNDVE